MLFREIAGQQGIKRKLVQTVLDHRVSHAQLFFGGEGSEKLALAIAYAQFINCTHKQIPTTGEGYLPDSCGTCPSCVKYQKLVHPDLHFIFPVATTKKVTRKPQSRDFLEEWRKFLIDNEYHVTLLEWLEYIGIENKQGIINADDCHDIITTLGYKSYESEYKVMIIWMVEKLFYAAAPKILKILEEPPDKTLFILVAEDPETIIPTILSRTLLVKVPRITEGELSDFLGRKFNISDYDAEIIARQAKGNLKLAIHRYQHTEEEEGNFRRFRDWMRLCFARDVAGLVNFVGDLSKIGRENQKNMLQYALRIVQSCASYRYQGESPVTFAGEELKFIKDISKFINPSNYLGFNDVFNQALYHVERNAYAPVLFLDVSLKILQMFAPYIKKKTG
jgi:DNA polymerase III subunit delta'